MSLHIFLVSNKLTLQIKSSLAVTLPAALSDAIFTSTGFAVLWIRTDRVLGNEQLLLGIDLFFCIAPKTKWQPTLST